jgi:hypothetical protein
MLGANHSGSPAQTSGVFYSTARLDEKFDAIWGETTLVTSWIGRIVVVAAFSIAGISAHAQVAYGPADQETTSPTSEKSREPSPSKGAFLTPREGKPVPGHGELLTLETDSGETKVVRLLATYEKLVVVMIPTGEIRTVERSKTAPTTKPFVAATDDEMLKSLEEADLKDYKIERGKYYLYAHNCSEGFYMHAKSILDTMLPGVVESLKSWGLKLKKPEVPMVVVIMPNRKAFDEYLPMPQQVAAYYNIITNRIMLYEDQELWEAAPEIALKHGAYTVAHEGVHQLLANTGVQARLSHWPEWVTEGLAEYYSPLKVHSSLVKKKNAELPERTLKWTKEGMVHDLDMYDLLQMKSASGDLMEQVVVAKKLNSRGYSMAWGLVHFLANNKDKSEKFHAYMKDLSKYAPMDEATEQVDGKPDPLFVKHFGEDFHKIEHELRKYLNGKTLQSNYVDPAENQTHYIVKCIQKVGKRFLVRAAITTSPAAAKKYKEDLEAEIDNPTQVTFQTIVCKTRSEAERQLAIMLK